jgi:hypothetical protein
MLLSLKDKHLGETAYILGSGPSLTKFAQHVDQHPGVYMGANQVYFNSQIKNKLNYLVTEMYQPELETMVDTTIYHCDKLTPIFKNHPKTFPYKSEFFQICSELGFGRGNFGGVSSSIFHVVLIAVHFGFKKLYIVGCDCTKQKHFYDWKPEHLETALPGQRPSITQGRFGAYHTLVNGWVAIRNTLKIKRPDVEIINVDPVALKDVFPSIYTS